jgi:prevent-host-death family protein
MPPAASVRELKNQTTALLRKVEKGTAIIVTRRGKPIATLKPFEEQDLQQSARYPTTMYDALRKQIERKYPQLTRRTPTQVREDFDRITRKARQKLPFSSWQEMDHALKGDRYGLTRQ